MKKAVNVLLYICISISLVACTLKLNNELKTQYDFYEESIHEIYSASEMTIEQADSIFLLLLSCGVESKI